jgi:hypothetical protein
MEESEQSARSARSAVVSFFFSPRAASRIASFAVFNCWLMHRRQFELSHLYPNTRAFWGCSKASSSSILQLFWDDARQKTKLIVDAFTNLLHVARILRYSLTHHKLNTHQRSDQRQWLAHMFCMLRDGEHVSQPPALIYRYGA